MKKCFAWILILAMLVAAIPLSVSAADGDYATLDAAVEMSRGNSKAVIDLYFSEPVHFVETSKSIAKLTNRYNTTGSTANGDWQHHTHNTDDSIYLNAQTGEDGKLYSNVIRLTFSKGEGGTASNLIPAGAAGVRLMESYTQDTNGAYDGVLHKGTIIAMSGKQVKTTHQLGKVNGRTNCETTWVDLTRMATLDDVQFDGWYATLTFSAPIHVVNLDDTIRACLDYKGASPQYLPRSFAYVGDVTEVEGVSYSKTIRVDFKHASSKIDGEKHGYVPKYEGYGVRLKEDKAGETAADGAISTKCMVGINGQPVAGTHKSGTDITFMAASAVRSLTQFVKAEVSDPASGLVTLTFSAPVNLDDVAGGFRMTWDYNPDDKAAGHYQFQPKTDIVYVDGEEYNGKTYGTTIQMAFNLGSYDSIPTNAGIRIIEYNKTADLGNCSVSPTVGTDKNGLPIAANRQAGSVDIAWQPITFVGATTKVVGAQMVDDAVVLVDFSRPVALNDISGITVAEKAAIAAESVSGAEYDGQWKITFADALDATNKAMIVLAASAMKDVYGCDLVTPAQALLDPWQDETIDHGEDFSDEMDSALPYHFMNTDTGRALAVGSVDEWYLEKIDGVNMYVLTDGEGQYLDLTGATPVLSDYPCKVLLVRCDNERYQLVVGGKMVLADSDEGEDADIALTRLGVDSQDIASGWYLTKRGEARPLRVMPLGDSITYGVNQDLASSELRVSYRAQLSQALTEYWGRVVFVGSEVTATTTLSETRLLRHAGFPGYVVTDIWGEAGHPGVDALIDGLCTKYAPDVVLLMLGTNDLTRMINAGTTAEGDLAAQIDRYETFLDTIDSYLGEQGTIVCSSLTPRAEGENVELKQTMVSTYNGLLEDMVDELAAQGTKIVFNDNFTAVDALGEAGLCSDKIHLSVAGSAALAEQYYRTVTAHYGTGSLKFDSLQTALNDQDKVVLTQDYTVDQLVIPIDTTLDLNGYTVTAAQVSAVTSASMIIDATEGKGGIKIAKNDAANETYYLQIVENNAMLPLYDSANGCYRFFTAQTTHLQKAGENSNSYKFGFQVDLADRAYELLKEAANADIALQTQLAVTVDGEEKVNKTYVFTAETLSLYAAKKLESTGNWAITLTVMGFDAIDGDIIVITSTPQVVSSTGVSVVPTADATRTYQYTRTGA